MLWVARQLLVPCNYLRIRHGASLLGSKAVYDFVLPAALSAATVGLCLWLDIPLAIFKHHELVKRLSDLLALMIVFYMAALAAVSTFERKGIDLPMKGGDALLKVRHHDGGHHVDKVLSYRQFISYLFGYLSFLSLCLYMALLFLSAGWPKIEGWYDRYSLAYRIFNVVLDPALFFAVFFAIWQLFITSLLGIYFLCERIQSLNDPEN